MAENKPSPELFLSRPRGGRPPGALRLFLDGLKVNEPQMLPEPYASKQIGQVTVDRWKKRNPAKRVACRTFEGKLWAMRLPDTEAVDA